MLHSLEYLSLIAFLLIIPVSMLFYRERAPDRNRVRTTDRRS